MSTPLIQKVKDFAEVLCMGFYRVDKEGRFLECDGIARETFKLPDEPEECNRHTITEYYADKEERQERLADLGKHGGPLKGVLVLRHREKEKPVYDICWRDNSEDNPDGCLGLVSPLPYFVAFPEMPSSFPIGFYVANETNHIVRCTTATAKAVGRDRPSALIGADLHDIYTDEGALKGFTAQVAKRGYARDLLRMRSQTGEAVTLEAFACRVKHKKHARWGLVHDVTKRERYFRALDQMPTGYYHIPYEKGQKHTIRHWNDAFSKMFGLQGIRQEDGFDIGRLYAHEKDIEKFMSDLEDRHKHGRPLRCRLEVKRHDTKELFWIFIECHLVEDTAHQVIAREGTVRDITKEVELEQNLMKVTADVNRLIHTFKHPVLKAAGDADMVVRIVRVLSPVTRVAIQPTSSVLDFGRQVVNLLEQAVEHLKDSEKHTQLVERLAGSQNFLSFYINQRSDDPLFEETVLSRSLDILELLGRHELAGPNGAAPVVVAELVATLRRVLHAHVIRIAEVMGKETVIMDRAVEAIRGYLGTKTKRDYVFVEHDLGDLLRKNIVRFQPVLLQRGLRISYDPSGDLKAEMSVDDADRLISNLLINAEKYSKPDPKRFILVQARELTDKKFVEFSVQSFGIAIKKEEIESGLVLQPGGRSDLAREICPGLGIGLADADDTVKAHNGTMTITSVPASPNEESDPPSHRVPYLTTITIQFPKKH